MIPIKITKYIFYKSNVRIITIALWVLKIKCMFNAVNPNSMRDERPLELQKELAGRDDPVNSSVLQRRE